MTEYLSEAVVLAKDANGDLDVRVSLFTKRFGKLTAKAKSARRITSKLSPHLEPGNLAQVRLVEKNGLQVVDALKIERLPFLPMDLNNLSLVLSEAEPDQRIWHELIKEKVNPHTKRESSPSVRYDKNSRYGVGVDWPHILGFLGWDPEEARCEKCGARPVVSFRVESQEFFCSKCSPKNSPNGVILFGS